MTFPVTSDPKVIEALLRKRARVRIYVPSPSPPVPPSPAELPWLPHISFPLTAETLGVLLYAMGWLQIHSVVTPFDIAPGNTVTWTFDVPEDKIYLLISHGMCVNKQGVISIDFYLDGALVHHDPAVYNIPTITKNNWFFTRFRNWKVIMTNNDSTDTVTVVHHVIYAETTPEYWKWFEHVMWTIRAKLMGQKPPEVRP